MNGRSMRKSMIYLLIIVAMTAIVFTLFSDAVGGSQEISINEVVALTVRGDAIILCHGGPIAEPGDAEYILRNCKHVNGFYGASSMERLPTEIALTEQTRKFKALTF